MKSLPVLSVLLGTLWTSAAFAQVTVTFGGNAAGSSGITLAGDMIDNIFVPRTGNALTQVPNVPPVNLGSFDIVINPGATLAGNTAALAAFNRAALAWEARISDPITITIDADLDVLGAGILGSASSVLLLDSYSVVRGAMVSDSSGEADDTIVASLPGTFTAAIPGGATLAPNLIATKANFKALGFTGLDVSFGALDGAVTFSTLFSFDFDNSDGVGSGLIDFETVAGHEIGHVLGFTSFVDSVNAGTTTITPLALDLFRFANNTIADPTTPAEFTSFPRNLIPGIAANTDEIFGPTPELAMSTGLLNGSYPGTDDRQASHWKADELTANFIGLMDPTLASGISYGPQESDFRALDLIGYDIVAVPEPSAVFAAFALFGLATWRERRAARRARLAN